MAVVERGGSVRSFHVDPATKASVRDVLVRNADRKSTLMTDESNFYPITGPEFTGHATVKHTGGEYVRYEAPRGPPPTRLKTCSRSSIAAWSASISIAAKPICIAEFDFRHNRRAQLGFTGFTDQMCVDAIMAGIEGKRLTYRRTGEAAHA